MNANILKGLLGLLLFLVLVGPAGAEDFSNGGFSFSTGPAPAFVRERPVETAWPADAPGANDDQWRFWRFDRQVDRRPGQDISYVDYIYEPRSQGNLGDAGRFDIQFNPEYQKLVLHRVELYRNGSWQSRLKPGEITIARREQQFEQEISDGMATALILIEDVRIGDVVRISYSIVGSNPILAGQQSESTRLAYGHPILDLRLQVLYPPGTEVTFHRENGAPAPTVTQTAEATRVDVGASRVDRLLNDGDYPVWFEPYPLVQISPKRNWAEVVAWALPLYPDRRATRLPEDLERRIAQWKALATPTEKLQAALRAVQDEVRYFGVETGTSSHRPREPELVWRRRYGDCKDKAWLLVTILDRLGIPAVPALVDTGRGRSVHDYAPSASLFDHVIVRARINGATVFVDPTMRLQGGTPQQTDLSQYGYVLPVAAGQAVMEEVLPSGGVENGIDESADFSPDGEGLRFVVVTEYRGRNADAERVQLDQSRLEDRARSYREYYGKQYGAIESLEPLAVNDDRQANRITIREVYRLAAPWKVENGLSVLAVEAGMANWAANLPSRVERRGPLDFKPSGRYRNTVTVQAPEGWVARFEGDADRIDSGAFRFLRTQELKDGKARLVTEMVVTSREVALDAVPAHVAALRKVRDLIRTRFVYRAPVSAEAAGREARLQNLLRNVMEER